MSARPISVFPALTLPAWHALEPLRQARKEFEQWLEVVDTVTIVIVFGASLMIEHEEQLVIEIDEKKLSIFPPRGRAAAGRCGYDPI